MKQTKEAKEIQAIVTTGILNYLENTKFEDADFECSNHKVSGISEFDAYLMCAIDEALDAVKSQFSAQWEKCNPHDVEGYKEVKEVCSI